MPTLELMAGQSGALQTANVVAYLDGVMFYPDRADLAERLRAAVITHKVALILPELVKAQPSAATPTELADAAVSAAGVSSLADISQELEVRRTHGVVAGKILIEALKDFHIGSRRGVEFVKEGIRRNLRPLPSFQRVSTSTINALWTRYRPVAHLWAAALRFLAAYVNAKATPDFPCCFEDVLLFLGWAESLRREATAYSPRPGHPPLLLPKASWVVPPGIPIPSYSIADLLSDPFRREPT